MMRRLILVPRKDGPGIISLPPPMEKYVPLPAAMFAPLSAAPKTSPHAESMARPQTDAHLPLGVLVVYEGISWTPVPTPRQRLTVPAPRQRLPVPAPRQHSPVPASPGPVPPVPASSGPVPPVPASPGPVPPMPMLTERPQESALPERPQESVPCKW